MIQQKKGDARLELEFETAFENYRKTDSVDAGKELSKALLAYLIRHRSEIAVYGPCLAMIVTLLERNHLPVNTWRRKIGVRILIWFLEKGLGPQVPPQRPGWNDYFMVRWQLTREQRWADEIHRRTHYRDPHMVGFTANWMANSQRQTDPDFDRALSVAETACGCLKSA